MALTERFISPTGAGAHDGTSEANAWTTAEAIAAIGVGPAAASLRCNIKVDPAPYAFAATSLVFNTAGAANFPVIWQGYKVAPGDQENNPWAVPLVDIPQWTFTTGNITVSGVHQWLRNLDISTASVTAAAMLISGSHCRFTGSRLAATGVNTLSRAIQVTGQYVEILNNNIRATTTAQQLILAATGTAITGNYLTGGAVGVAITSGLSVPFLFNIFDAIGGDAIQVTTGSMIAVANLFYSPVGHGILLSGTPTAMSTLVGNHFENFNSGKLPFNNTSGTPSGLVLNINGSYFNCPSGTIGGQGDIPAPRDKGILASAGFPNGATGDFTPSTALQAIGFPGKYQGMTGFQGYMDNGPIQRQEPASGGRTPMYRIRGG